MGRKKSIEARLGSRCLHIRHWEGWPLLCTGSSAARKREQGACSFSLASHMLSNRKRWRAAAARLFGGASGDVRPLKFDEDGATILLKHQPFHGNWFQESHEGIPEPTLSNATSLSNWTTDLKTEGLDQKGGAQFAMVGRWTEGPADARGVETTVADSGPPEDTPSVHFPVM